jgi:hypothetical protein
MIIAGSEWGPIGRISPLPAATNANTDLIGSKPIIVGLVHSIYGQALLNPA